MGGSPQAIFVSYRRNDAKWFVGRFGERLRAAFEPRHTVFLDVDSIPAGRSFREVIGEALDASDVVLVVIGPGWLAAADSEGRSRLADPDDWVRMEVETALRERKRVIPVLVDDTPMPRASALPESLRPLVGQQRLKVGFEGFERDVGGLIRQVERALAEEATRPRQRPPPSLDPEHVTKAEALAHWEFVKGSDDEAELRHHLAQFPGAVTARMARRRLEDVVWRRVRGSRDAAVVRGFLEEFGGGRHAGEAQRRLRALERPPGAGLGRVSPLVLGLLLVVVGIGVVGLGLMLRGISSAVDTPATSLVVQEPDEDAGDADQGDHGAAALPPPAEEPEPKPKEVARRAPELPRPVAPVAPAAAAPCGNGREDPGEQCDFGTADNDGKPGGCSSDCRLLWATVPAGLHTIGATPGEGDNDDEGPQRTVHVDRPYRMLATKVTEAQRRRFGPRQDGDNVPWVSVSWDEAQRYCHSLSAALPTEVEWEVAARGRTTTPWSCGASESCLDDAAWYSANSGGRAHPVGGKRPNPFGLFDMHGNVLEWVEDCYDSDAWKSVTSATTVVTKTPCRHQVLRGGTYNYVPELMRSASRSWGGPTEQLPYLGFRCVSGSRRQP